FVGCHVWQTVEIQHGPSMQLGWRTVLVELGTWRKQRAAAIIEALRTKHGHVDKTAFQHSGHTSLAIGSRQFDVAGPRQPEAHLPQLAKAGNIPNRQNTDVHALWGLEPVVCLLVTNGRTGAGRG